MKMYPPVFRRLRPRAFSFVEVMLSVGIAATTLVLLLGLLPCGLDEMTRSASAAAEVRALQVIQTDYQMREWAEVLGQQSACTGELFRFDAQGFLVRGDDAEALFLTRVLVEDGPVLPGSAQKNSRLRTLVMQISSNLDEKKAFAGGGRYREQRTLLAQADKQP